MAEGKLCTKCGADKPLDAYYRNAARRDGRQSICQECERAGKRKFYEANRERVLAANYARERKDPAARRRAVSRWRTANREHQLALQRDWRVRNPEKLRENTRGYRARKRAAWVAPVEEAAIITRDEGHCGICGGPLDGPRFHIDHVIPLAAGGTHEPNNVQLAHPTCNLRKNKRLDYEAPAA